MLHAVVMAGGTGTRFWPESRSATPKQLLNLVGERSMIQMTIGRLGDLVPPERVLVVTGQGLAAAIAAQLPRLPPGAILVEPCRRDTAPCIGLAALAVLRSDPDAVMVVMPADHVIHPNRAFQQAVGFAVELIEERPERIVTFGIRPSYPAEIFGYIQRGERLAIAVAGRPPVYAVTQFREKPDGATAKAYLETGGFYWNAGIFVWKARTILDALEQHQPALHARLTQIAAAWGTPEYEQVLDREFNAIQAVSIDYAVMEHARDVLVIEAPFGWDDVGSWRSLARLRGTDAEGNTVVGKHLGVNTRGSIVRNTSPDHLVVTLGISDCIVVHTPEATLVANKHDEEAIRQVVRLLEEKGWREYL